MMAKRSLSSSRDVPYLTKHQIEDEVNVLLAEYSEQHAKIAAPPIPIDEIIEFHLGLVLELKDMRQLFGMADVHGVLWVNDKIVGVDQGLDPSRYPSMLGRFHFTLAHEAGHWRLHRQFYLKNTDQRSLFEETPTKPAYVCRSTEAKKPVEWQADFFAACALMPRPMVISEWESWRGDPETVYLDDLLGSEQAGGESAARLVMDRFSRPLAEKFAVSAEAMRIRLEELGLLARKRENTLF